MPGNIGKQNYIWTLEITMKINPAKNPRNPQWCLLSQGNCKLSHCPFTASQNFKLQFSHPLNLWDDSGTPCKIFRKITKTLHSVASFLLCTSTSKNSFARLLYRKKLWAPPPFPTSSNSSRPIEQKENVNIQSWGWHDMQHWTVSAWGKSVRVFWRDRRWFHSIPRLFSTCQRWRIPLAAILLTTICARFPRPHSNVVTQGERLLQRQIRLTLASGISYQQKNQVPKPLVQLGSKFVKCT